MAPIVADLRSMNKNQPGIDRGFLGLVQQDLDQCETRERQFKNM